MFGAFFSPLIILAIILSSSGTEIAGGGGGGGGGGGDHCSITDIHVDAVVAVDTSNSVNWDDYGLGMKFVGRFIDYLGKHANGTRFGMFQYSDKIQTDIPFGFHDNWTLLSDSVTKATRLTGRETHTVTALKTMLGIFANATGGRERTGPTNHDRLTNSAAIRLGFVITDGESHQKAVAAAAAALVAANVSVYGIGVGGVNLTELTVVAGGNENNTFYAKNYGELREIERRFHQRVCKEIMDSNRFVEIAKISGGVLVAIIAAILVGMFILYRAQSLIRSKLELARLQAAEEAIKKSSSDVNPMYKTPLTKINPGALGVALNGAQE